MITIYVDNCNQNLHLGRYIVIPILLRFYSLVSNWRVASHIKPHKGVRHPTKCDLIYDVKLFPTDILSQIFDVIQSEVALQKQVH